MTRKTLKQIGYEHGTDKFRDDINYTEPYLRYFEAKRDEKLKILEIGIARGSGLLTWNEYFKNSQIFGLENWHKHSKTASDTIEKLIDNKIYIFEGDQSSREYLYEMTSITGNFDIIIDDGGHTMNQQQTSLGYLFPFLKSGGIYVIEDLVTSYDDFGNGFHRIYPEGIQADKKVSTLEFLKGLESGNIKSSPFMNTKELEYLKDNLKSCEVLENLGIWNPEPGISWPSAMSVIVKKIDETLNEK